MIEIELPIRLKSPNIKEHWTKTYNRDKHIRQVLGYSLWADSKVSDLRNLIWRNTKVAKNKKPSFNGLKIKITLIKLGRPFDYDNMVYAFKSIRDSVCSFFYPGLAPGQADCQDCFDIHYLQEKGGSGIKIIIETIGPP